MRLKNYTDVHNAAAAWSCRGAGTKKTATNSELKPTVLQTHHVFNELIFLQMITYFGCVCPATKGSIFPAITGEKDILGYQRLNLNVYI